MVSVISRGISCSRVLRGEVRASGAIFDPFVYRGKGGQPLSPMLTRDGLRERWGLVRSHLKSGVCAGIIQKHVPGFHASKFPITANEIFKSFCDAHRKGDMRTLAGVTTEEFYASLKGDINRAKKAGARRKAFVLLGFKGPTHVLQMREYRRKNVSDREGWGQVTCKLHSERRLVTMHSDREEVEQKDTVTTDNITIGTFEVFFGDDQKRWRLALVEELGPPPDSSSGGALQ